MKKRSENQVFCVVFGFFFYSEPLVTGMVVAPAKTKIEARKSVF
jgi:dolichyl-phosphate-mannose--protein O-mannosyl transferase